MIHARFFSRLVVVCILSAGAAMAQPAPAVPTAPASADASHAIRLDLVVDNKSGQPVANLTRNAFTLLDNKAPRPIRSFRVMTPAQEPVRVILLFDTVNTPFELTAYVRDEVEKYLKGNRGVLAQPTTFALLSDQGVQVENEFTTDGTALSASIDRLSIGLREIRQDSQWSGDERLQICLTAMNQLTQYASTFPGRKIVIWISPGWPLISGPEVYLSDQQEQQIFSTVVSFSTRFRAADVTLYNINPVGVSESLIRADYYKDFLQGVSRPGDVMPGDLGLQVLSVQSGGLAIESNSDVTGMIRKCLADVSSWYEITFDPAPSDAPNQYHHVAFKLDQKDLTARTRDGYYANPTFTPQH